MLLAAASAIHTQTAPAFTSLPAISFDTSSPVLRAPAQPQKPFTVAGPHGVLLGQQDGTLEAWILPVKILSHLTIEARVQGYSVPIDVNQQAAAIEVRPDRTILTYSHIGFTVRQIMFSPPAAGTTGGAATGPIVLFEFDCLHPTDFTFRFTPNLLWMWPARNEGIPGVEWVSPDPHNPQAAGGFYALHSDYPDLAAALTIPGAAPGILAPYQERPKDYPVELTLHIDPARDRSRLFPLLMAVGMNPTDAATPALAQSLAHLNTQIPALYAAQSQTYKDLLAHSVSIETPDKSLDQAFLWSVISIEQLRTAVPPTATPPELANSAPETALVAGYYSSADSARPGFGWFFGRDALYTLYAIHGFGDFQLARAELEFLIHRQRADGKIMHEYSQTAAVVNWQQFPYQWAAADSTPLFLLAVADYVRSSGDTAFLIAHHDAIDRAWAFETDPAHDTDHDGIYDNSQGTGWVESWPGGMPHQEIYLALLDQQASSAYAWLQTQLKDEAKASTAQLRAATIARTINAEYYDSQKSCYAFSRNSDGSLDRTSTIYPALAWWDPANGRATLDHPEACLRQFAASALNTDWGTRDVANDEPIYDGMSYHQGSVWPLFTGWAALAEYRANQPLAGYQLLKENAQLTTAQDLGAHTELLSGDFFVPMGRSTSHQLWSSAMIITPTLRGLFGLSIDATTKTITVNPHLPASWDHAEILNLPLPKGGETIGFERTSSGWVINLTNVNQSDWRLRSDQAGSRLEKVPAGDEPTILIPTPQLEFDPMLTGFATNVSDKTWFLDQPPIPGARTSRFRVLHSEYGDHKLTLTCEGLAGTQVVASLIRHGAFVPKVQPDATSGKAPAIISAKDGWAFQDPKAPLLLIMDFPPGTGFQTLTVTLTW
jgi:glycogen debranching enzyme